MTKKRKVKKEQEEALQLAQSIRGRLIIGKALAYAITAMEKLHPEFKEYSDIQDMKFIGENLFAPFFQLYSENIKLE